MKGPDIFILRKRLRRARILRVRINEPQEAMRLSPKEEAIVVMVGILIIALFLLAILGLAALYAYNETWGKIAALVFSGAVIATAIFVYIKDLHK